MKRKRNMKLVSLDGLLEYLHEKCEMAGGAKAWAARQRPVISFGYVCAVLRRDAKPGPRILKALKAKEQTMYVIAVDDENKDSKALMKFEDIE